LLNSESALETRDKLFRSPCFVKLFEKTEVSASLGAQTRSEGVSQSAGWENLVKDTWNEKNSLYRILVRDCPCHSMNELDMFVDRLEWDDLSPSKQLSAAFFNSRGMFSW
jgi:hypothetical protein